MSNNQNSVINAKSNQSTIDPQYKNIARGRTIDDKSQIILENTVYIGALLDLIAGFDTTISSEPITHALDLIQRLNREILINQVGISDYLNSVGGAK